MAENALEILITAKDEATAKLDGIKGSIKNVALAAAGVGAAITGAMGLSVKAAAEAQEKMAGVDATLNSMVGTSKQVLVGYKTVQETITKGADMEISKTGALVRAKTELHTKTIAVYDSIKMTAEAIADSRKKILDAAAATTKLGFDDEDAAQSISKLYQHTGDLSKAIQANGVAMDLARAKHIDLSSASKLVSLAMEGGGKALTEYNITLKKGETGAQALAELQQKLSGQAEAYAKTQAGATEIINQNLGNLQEKIGEQLLPIIAELTQRLVPIIEKILNWADANPKLTQAIVVVTAAIGGLLVVLPALIGFIAAIASPIGLTVLAIAALSAAVIAVGVVIYTNWDKIKEKTKETFEMVANFIHDCFEKAKNWVFGYINQMIDKINELIAAANKVTGVASSIGISVPKISSIPKLAEGGIVTSPTIAMIGEAGPEAVVPLNRSGGFAGGAQVTVIVNGDVSGQELVEKVGQQLTDMLKMNFAVV